MNAKESNNFCRVFEIPTDYPEGYLFAGGKPVEFLMVDWFNPIPATDIWENNIRDWSYYVPLLRKFLADKSYVKPGRGYLLLTNFGECMTFTGGGAG